MTTVDSAKLTLPQGNRYREIPEIEIKKNKRIFIFIDTCTERMEYG